MEWEKEINGLVEANNTLTSIAISLSDSNANPNDVKGILNIVKTNNNVIKLLTGKSSIVQDITNLSEDTKEKYEALKDQVNNLTNRLEENSKTSIPKLLNDAVKEVTLKSETLVNSLAQTELGKLSKSNQELTARVKKLETKPAAVKVASGEGKILQLEKQLKELQSEIVALKSGTGTKLNINK